MLYDIITSIVNFHLKLIAHFNTKLKLGVDGRAKTFEILNASISKTDKTVWFHCASLGEYEQGLPVFKNIRNDFPSHKIILTFFSPSGYEIRKNTDIADVVVYLPLDTKKNAKLFLEIVHPELTIFVKYDFWPNYLNELKKRQLKAILISAVFRESQSFFKFYGSRMRNALKAFEHIFVQDNASKALLNTIHFSNVSVSGDTRFDRVSDQLKQDNKLPFIEAFKADNLCVVIGSSWPEDEDILIKFINTSSLKNIKYIIAPHNIKPGQIQNLVTKLQPKTVLFSEKENKTLSEYSILIIDTIGILSKIYSYADIAYVGGAIGTTGLHNILEPAVFGVPIIIGNRYDKFPEAFKMIADGGVISISNFETLQSKLNMIIENPSKRAQLGNLNKLFIEKNKGAVVQIMDFIRK
ncbi:MAG: glycosyltransferase N-terminal domain-containing protein [Gelidibacter sp.]|nr:3-deoxy-D-manno-octulosonic acid transferase [Gelidibacter sp.]